MSSTDMAARLFSVEVIAGKMIIMNVNTFIIIIFVFFSQDIATI